MFGCTASVTSGNLGRYEARRGVTLPAREFCLGHPLRVWGGTREEAAKRDSKQVKDTIRATCAYIKPLPDSAGGG